MKKDLIQFVIAFFALVLAGAGEEFAPKMLGVGFPFLLSCAAYGATKRTPLVGILFAVAAGAMEDSLSGLPFVLSVSYFTFLTGLMRGFKLPILCAVPAFCIYQIWLWIWLGNSLNGSVYSRFFAAIPLGAVTLLLVWAILSWIDRKAAVHEK